MEGELAGCQACLENRSVLNWAGVRDLRLPPWGVKSVWTAQPPAKRPLHLRVSGSTPVLSATYPGEGSRRAVGLGDRCWLVRFQSPGLHEVSKLANTLA